MKLLHNLRNNDKKTYVLLYTFLFCLLTPLVFYWFIKGGRSFIWINDGGDQHYIALLYYGRTLREWIGGIFQGNGFAFPLYDFTIGQGDDVLTTMHYYCLGDPLALLSVFCPEQYTEYLYNFLVLLRFYLMGLSFLAFGFYQKKEGSHVLLGAFLYAFCGFALIGAIKHPFFLNPMIYLPLLCLSIEKVLRKESRKLFIVMTALCAMSNFYFFYMLTVLAVLYALVRFGCMYLPEVGWSVAKLKQWWKERKRAKKQAERQALAKKTKKGHIIKEQKKKEKPAWLLEFMEIVPRGIGAYLTGVCIASFIFIPVVMRFLNNPRYVEDASKVKLVYKLDYYGRMLGSFTGKAWTPGYWAYFGFAPIVILALCVLFTKKERKARSLQILTVLGVLFLLFPVFGYILNGFDYVSNRWMFAFHFLMAYIVVEMLPDLLSGMKKYAIYLCGIVMTGLLLVNVVAHFNGNRVDAEAYVMLLLVFGFCIFMGNWKKKQFYQSIYFIGLFVLSLYSVVYNGSTVLKSKRTQFYPVGELYEYLDNQPSSQLAALEEDTFYRVDSYVAKSWDRDYGVENPTQEELLEFFRANGGATEEEAMGDEDIDSNVEPGTEEEAMSSDIVEQKPQHSEKQGESNNLQDELDNVIEEEDEEVSESKEESNTVESLKDKIAAALGGDKQKQEENTDKGTQSESVLDDKEDTEEKNDKSDEWNEESEEAFADESDNEEDKDVFADEEDDEDFYESSEEELGEEEEEDNTADTIVPVVQKGKKIKKFNNYNLSLMHGYYGLSEYFSMLNPYYPVYVNKMALSSSNYSSQIASLDQRTTLNAIAAVKYYMASDFECYPVPYGYKEVEQYYADDGKIMTLYENQYALPLAFTYDEWIDEKTLGSINRLKKQEVMLTTLVLNKGQNTSGLPEGLTKRPASEIIQQDVVWSENNSEELVKKNKSIKFPYAKAWAEFTMEGVENCEVYVYLQDVKFSKSSVGLVVCADDLYKWTNVYSTSKKEYFGRNNILFNLGYREDGLTSFALYTSKPGKLSFKKISVLLVPMDTYEEKITALQDEPLENIQMSTNRIEGTVTASEDKMLFFSVPYSKGVHAKVNGKNVPVYQANWLYLAVPVNAGENTVVLTYRTPGLLMGMLLSIGTVCVLGVISVQRKRNKNFSGNFNRIK